MAAYLLKRLLLIIPTMFGIMLISFTIIQFAPGGPVERVIAQITGTEWRPPPHRRQWQRRADERGPLDVRAERDLDAAASRYRPAIGQGRPSR